MMKFSCLAILAVIGIGTFVETAEAQLLRRRRAVPSYSAPTTAPTVPLFEQPSMVAPSAEPNQGFDGLDEVNAKRVARGLRPFIRDDGLTLAARACAAFRAKHSLFGHTSNDFAFVPAGTSCSSTGCAAYPSSYGWMSCCVYDGYTFAGAAWVPGRDGQRYMHLFVR